MVKRTNFFALIFLLILASCGSMSYKYYHLVPTDDGKLDGKLIGEKPKDDTDLQKFCVQPNGQVKCVVLDIDEYFQLIEDFEVTKKMLEDCERKLP